MTLPNFLIIGAEKAGTTWLYRCLNRHPDIYLPDTKELHFFNAFDSNLNRRDRYSQLGFDWYEGFFRDHAGERAIGEVTPMYLCDPEAAGRIRRHLPDVRLICSLRDPVDRACSHYFMAQAKTHTNCTFEEIVSQRDERIIGRGCYSDQLTRYFDLFGSDRILVLIFEEIFADPGHALARIGDFLDVETSDFAKSDWSAKENPATSYRSPWLYNKSVWLAQALRSRRSTREAMRWLKASGLVGIVKKANRTAPSLRPLSGETRQKLAALYQPEVQRVETLLGRRIDAWHESNPEPAGQSGSIR